MTQGASDASITVERIGRDGAALRALATLRMTVFRSWPYLYDGSLDYEAGYLGEFLRDEAAVLIVARSGDVPVGMATASPMAGQSDAVTAPFVAAGLDPATFFYFGESVLLPRFRGLGIGHRFFDLREAAARAAGATAATFAAVVRDPNHPARPQDARELAPFWERRGYRADPRLTMTMHWKELGASQESDHTMRFWRKSIADGDPSA